MPGRGFLDCTCACWGGVVNGSSCMIVTRSHLVSLYSFSFKMAFGMYGIDACQDPDGFTAWLAGNQGNDAITNAECVWGTGSTYALIACILYFGSGVVLCCAPQPDPCCKQ